MNVPFRFTFADTKAYGVIVNFAGTAFSSSVVNDIYNALSVDAQNAADLRQPSGLVRLIGFSLGTNIPSTQLSIGIYDTVATTFTELVPTVVTGVAPDEAQVQRATLTPGPKFELSATKLLCVKRDTTANGLITGDVDLVLDQPYTLPADGIGPPIPTPIILDETGAAILDESSLNIINE